MGWYKGFLKEGALAAIAQYINGVWSVAGVPIPATLPYAWADFILLDWTALDGKFFRVTDVHAVGATGGSIWQADAVGDRPILVSNQIQVASLALAYSTYPPSTYPGLRVLPADVGSVMVAVGSEYLLASGECVLSRDAVIKKFVSPATAVTATTDLGGGLIKLTAAAHLLTAGVVGTDTTYVFISGGGTWPAGAYLIGSYIDANNYSIHSPSIYTGNPTVVLAGTEFVIKSVTIPPMTVNGYLGVDATWGSTSGTGAKTPGVRLGTSATSISGDPFYLVTGTAAATVTCIHPLPIMVQNRGSVSSQVNQFPAANVGGGANSSGTPATTGTVSTGVTTYLNFTGTMASANDPIWLERSIVKMGT